MQLTILILSTPSIQAEKQLTEDWTLQRSHQPGVVEIDVWISRNLKGQKVGGDPALLQVNP